VLNAGPIARAKTPSQSQRQTRQQVGSGAGAGTRPVGRDPRGASAPAHTPVARGFHPLQRDLYKKRCGAHLSIEATRAPRSFFRPPGDVARPAPPARIRHQPELSRLFATIVGERGIVQGRASLKVYECDGYTLEKGSTGFVVLPPDHRRGGARDHAAAAAGVAFVRAVPATGVSGRCLPVGGAGHGRHWRASAASAASTTRTASPRSKPASSTIEDHAPRSRRASPLRRPTVEPVRLHHRGQRRENSGGPHTLKYGVTVNHVLGARMVLADGQVLWLDREGDAPGYDLVGLLTGSEGTLGLVTAARVRLVRKPRGRDTLLATFGMLPMPAARFGHHRCRPSSRQPSKMMDAL